MPKKYDITVMATVTDDDGATSVEIWLQDDAHTEAAAQLLREEIADAVQEWTDEMFRCQMRNEHPTDPRADAGGFNTFTWGDFELRMP